jgi:HlyD family secretion protein
MPRPPAPLRKEHKGQGDGPPHVWVSRDGRLEAIEVRTGATNGKVTEILGGGLEAGTEVVTESLNRSP